MTSHDPVLITGCSSGIGEATATLLVRAGHTVYATARRPGTLSALERLGCRTLALDVTDEDSMVSAVQAVEAEHGQVGALVNNAGYGEYGPVEEADLGRARAMFETNVFGLGRLIQLVLPGMRRAGRGRIVNIGSFGGRLVFPVGGYYHASKYAVEAISDALRMEVKPFGIQIALVEPGLIRTNFGAVVAQSLEGTRPAHGGQAHGGQAHGGREHGEGTAYAGLIAGNDAMLDTSYASNLMSSGPEVVASVVLRAVEAARPRPRYVVTPAAKAMVGLRKYGGDRLWDAAMRRLFGG